MRLFPVWVWLCLTGCAAAVPRSVRDREDLWERAAKAFNPGKVDTLGWPDSPDTLIDTSYVVMMAGTAFDSGLVRRAWARRLVREGTLLSICDSTSAFDCPTKSSARHVAFGPPTPAGGDTVRVEVGWVDLNPTRCRQGIGTAYVTGTAFFFVPSAGGWREVMRAPRRPEAAVPSSSEVERPPDKIGEVLFLSGDVYCGRIHADVKDQSP